MLNFSLSQRQNRIYILFLLIFLFLSLGVSAEQDDKLSRKEKIEKAKEHYERGKEFYERREFESADLEFKKAQNLLEDLKPLPTYEVGMVEVGMVPIQPAPSKDSASFEAWEFSKRGQSHQAISSYLKAIRAQAKNANLYYNLALEYIKTNQFKLASNALKKVIQLNPKDADAYYNLGILYEIYLDNKRKALDYYLRYIKIAPQAEDSGRVKVWIKELQEQLKK